MLTRSDRFLKTAYKIEDNQATTTRLNLAIKRGAEKGVFTLPKGISGKVKLSQKKAATAVGPLVLLSVPSCSRVAQKPASKVSKPAGAVKAKKATTKKPVSLASSCDVSRLKNRENHQATKTVAKVSALQPL